MNKIKLILFLMLIVGNISAQNIFPEKFGDCNTDQFALESDLIIAKLEKEQFIKVILTGLSDKTKNKISGKLFFQIIVDLQGNSCLTSVKNETNIKTKKMNLKQVINTNLIWEKPPQKVSTIVFIEFRNNQIAYTRLGIDGRIGLREITNQKKAIDYSKVKKERKGQLTNNPKVIRDKDGSVWKLFTTSNSVIPENMSQPSE